MIEYFYKTQHSENYIDEFNEKGLIDKERAVLEFQMFPWEKEIDDFRRSSNNPTIPKIVFFSDDKRQLSIEAVNLKGFNITYENTSTKKISEFYLSNNFESKNYTPEEMIDYFYDNTIESHISSKNLIVDKLKSVEKEVKKKSKKEIEYQFKPNHLKIFGFSPFLFIIFSIFIYVLLAKHNDKDFEYIFYLSILAWFPNCILHASYYIKNLTAKVIIDTNNHNLTYIKGNKSIKFNRDDIFRCQVTISKYSYRYPDWNNYAYVWFILKDKKGEVIITCLLCDYQNIIDDLKCKYEIKERFIPLLPIDI